MVNISFRLSIPSIKNIKHFFSICILSSKELLNIFKFWILSFSISKKYRFSLLNIIFVTFFSIISFTLLTCYLSIIHRQFSFRKLLLSKCARVYDYWTRIFLWYCWKLFIERLCHGSSHSIIKSFPWSKLWLGLY